MKIWLKLPEVGLEVPSFIVDTLWPITGRFFQMPMEKRQSTCQLFRTQGFDLSTAMHSMQSLEQAAGLGPTIPVEWHDQVVYGWGNVGECRRKGRVVVNGRNKMGARQTLHVNFGAQCKEVSEEDLRKAWCYKTLEWSENKYVGGTTEPGHLPPLPIPELAGV